MTKHNFKSKSRRAYVGKREACPGEVEDLASVFGKLATKPKQNVLRCKTVIYISKESKIGHHSRG